MNHFIATLSAEAADNWDICRRELLWGTPARASQAKYAVRLMENGDRLIVWQSGLGVIATATIVGTPFEFGSTAEVPWPEPDRYRFGIRLTEIQDLGEPIADPFDGYTSRRFGVQTNQLQSGLAILKDEQARALSEAVDGAQPTAAQLAPERTPKPRTVVVAEERAPLAAAYLQPSSSVAEALLALYRQNRTAAESGELILIGPAELRSEFEDERTKPPFDELGDRVKFVTPDELEALRALGS